MSASTDFARRRLGTGLADLSAANEILNNLDNAVKTGETTTAAFTSSAANTLSGANNLTIAQEQFDPTAVVSKTADYPLVASDSGKQFDNTGAAGSVNFTLPAVATSKGFWASFFVVVDQQIAITAPAGTLVGPNNAARSSYTTGASGQRIGTAIQAYCNGAKWFLFVDVKGLTAGTYA